MNKNVWNKGLTKETSKSITKGAERLSEVVSKKYKNGYINPFKGKQHTEEFKNRYKWKQIVQQYTNVEELKQLIQIVPFKELTQLWNCSEDVIYTLRQKLGLKHKRVWKKDLLQKYTKEQLQEMYLNQFDRYMEKMAVYLDCHITTLSSLFRDLGIKRQPHHPSEYESSNKKISEKAKERAANGFVFGSTIGESSLEKKVREELEKQKIVFLQEYRVPGSCADFYLPDFNICIYVDGCYVHGCRQCFHWNKMDLTKERNLVAYQAPSKDQRITDELTKNGYKVYRFWEHEINASTKDCIDKIAF